MNKAPFNFNQIKVVYPLLAIFPSGQYGIEHAYRVFTLAQKIADFENLNEGSCQSLKFCALFLNIGRDQNRMDLNYGTRSYEMLIQNNFWGKSVFHNDLCRFLIECHPFNIAEAEKKLDRYMIENPSEAIFLFKILKDASALDAFRFGNFCAADLQFSNSRKLVLFASQLYRKEVKLDLILKEIENWMESIQ